MSKARLFDDNMYRFDTPQPSYWEATGGEEADSAGPLARDASCDVAIIGGGYTGLSAAYHLARDYDVDTRVLEAGHIGWGASGRNGGFSCMGGCMLGTEELVKKYGVDAVRKHYDVQARAVELVRDIINDEGIDSHIQGDGEVEVAHSKRAFEASRKSAERQAKTLGIDISVVPKEEFRERFFDCTNQHGGSIIKPTFGIHPLRYAKGLASAATKHGATLHPHSHVDRWEKVDGWHRLVTSGGTLRAKKVILATNGFLTEDLHPTFAARVLPIISAIVVTRPLADDELAAHHWKTEHPSYNTRPLMNYFRLLPDKRFMFGGRGHSTGDQAGTDKNFAQLIANMHAQWPEWANASIDYRWHGFVCATSRLTPCVGRLPEDPEVFFGFGYHGNGVNNSNWVGKLLADWIGSGEDKVPELLPEVMQGLSDRFPLPDLRLRVLQAALTWKRFRNWLA